MIIQILKIIFWKIQSVIWFLIPSKAYKANNFDFSIGIVTYIDRYNLFFKRLIKKTSKLFPNQPILVCVNGYYDKEKQESYLEDIKEYCSFNKNIKLLIHVKPQGLSSLWNKLIKNSNQNKVLILNDDIDFSFFFPFELLLKNTHQKEFSLINNTWSCFFISKGIFSKVGDFDEKFTEVGMEDGDYELRMILKKIQIKSSKFISFKNIIFNTIEFSYGNDTNQVIHKKYRKKNFEIFNQKWEFSPISKPNFLYNHKRNIFFKQKN